MQKLPFIALSLLIISSTACFSQKADRSKNDKKQEVRLVTKQDTISYIIGTDIGNNLRQANLDLNIPSLVVGITTALNGTDTLFQRNQVDSIMKVFQAELMQKRDKESAAKADVNIKLGKAFLAENLKKEGIQVTPSGLQYKILTTGSGVAPTSSDEVTVYYKGTLIDGTVFDQSKEGEPISFPLGGVIPGWTEGLQLLKPGGKAMLYIPSELGYGNREVGPIPAGSTLIFEVELISIKAKE